MCVEPHPISPTSTGEKITNQNEIAVASQSLFITSLYLTRCYGTIMSMESLKHNFNYKNMDSHWDLTENHEHNML